MNTPSTPFEKALSTNAISTLPEHMTRISLISVEYCSLETPARSAAPYAHQWHTKPNIRGLNVTPVPIHSHLIAYIINDLFTRIFLKYYHPTQHFVMISSSEITASISHKSSSSVKCFSCIAFVAHFALQRPSPLQRTELTMAFLPFGVSWNSMAPYVHTVMHAPHEIHLFSSTSQTAPEATTVSRERSVRTRPAAP